MNDTLRLGRIGGVRVGVNWTVLVIFALITYGLAGEQLPRAYKGLHPLAYALGGLLTATAFLASLLAHELAHALVARRNGLTVTGITLWLLGGVARYEGEPATPGAEVRIAGSGPLVSMLLATVFGAASGVLHLARVDGLVSGCVTWLALINALLAVFNTIPAAPLDGGRLVHALLWRRSGDRVKATLQTTQVGRAFGWATMLAGFYIAMWSADGLWLTLVGWFLITAAGLEAGQARVRARLDGVPIRRIMTPDPFTVPSSMPVAAFLREMLPRHRHSAYPVVDNGVVRGIVTTARVRGEPPDTPLGTLIEDAERTTAETPLTELLPRLARERLLVFDGDRLVGIVTPHDLTRELEHLAREVPGFPAR
ncbi:site-2 protease family protein [Actinoallomurus soli]|uniref:site-2 protease family protein n=1 Tax=Actinoallomurus soli TaxID=2952535 RepID=UPI002093468D|nr:site-2 protease family protein [Actinoallomurus soli]MCO5972587.1 site-2 protease family protein [Actinoallomurus soli]